MIEKQELHCHECGRYVQFELDMSLSGNHVLDCPNCGHEHCRVVKDGRITSERWDQRNRNSFSVTTATSTSTAMYDTSSSSSQYLTTSWVNTGTATGSTTVSVW